jgi:hypothetical protein
MNARFVEILRRLVAHDVEFVVVGMTAGVLQGAPLTTLDLAGAFLRLEMNMGRPVQGGRGRPKLRALLLAVTVLALLAAAPAGACSCVAAADFEELARAADTVVVGRIQTRGEAPSADGTEVAYLDVEVLGLARGEDHRRTVRIWDGAFGTTCSVGLRRFVAGGHAAFVLAAVGDRPHPLLESARLAPDPADYVLSPCGNFDRTFTSREAALAFLASTRHKPPSN